MSNELDKLAEAFKREDPILPREEARRDAIAAAMDRFDEENSHLNQGSPSAERLKGQGNTLLTALRRRLSMTFTNKNLGYILTGSASLAAMAIVVMNTNMIPELPSLKEAAQLKTDNTTQPAAAVARQESEADDARTSVVAAQEAAPEPPAGVVQNQISQLGVAKKEKRKARARAGRRVQKNRYWLLVHLPAA